MNKKATTETSTTTATETVVRKNTTTIFVYWQDPDGEKGVSEFKSKPELDTWMSGTTVNVLKVIRGRERKIARKIVFQ